jgi:hypothetical protein
MWMSTLWAFAHSIFPEESGEFSAAAFSRCKRIEYPSIFFCSSMRRCFDGYPEEDIDRRTEKCSSYLWSLQVDCGFQKWTK